MTTPNTPCPITCCVQKSLGCLLKLVECKLALLAKIAPFFNIVPRLVIASVFWKSGTLKLPSGFLGIGRGNWDTTIALFTNEYHVPLLSPTFAAYSAATFEILCPILLVLGLGSRAAAALLLIMTAVIEFTYVHSMENVYWATILGVLIVQGPGVLALDHLIRKKTTTCPVYGGMIGRK